MFTEITREEVHAALCEAGVRSPYIELAPTDTISNCVFHCVHSDIREGFYALEHFVQAHKAYEDEGKDYNGHDVRSRASHICATGIVTRSFDHTG